MSVRYHCSHTSNPHPPLPPAYPSSSSSFSRLDSLYFCEECDAVRCDQCVAVEVASYYCPNCLFDVPSANVRGDKNRCARSCFACPHCTAALQVIPAETLDPSTSRTVGAFLLTCPCCKWSSREVGWEFEKATGIALQLQKTHKQAEAVQAEFEALKDHLDAYMSSSTPAPAPATTSTKPSRHISHLTQMAANAVGRDVPGMAKVKIRRPGDPPLQRKSHDEWDDIGEYKTKASWKAKGWEAGLGQVEQVQSMQALKVAPLDQRWAHSWDRDPMAKSTLPQRIPLQTKTTKRCPEGSCRHLLIQPDTKSTRFKIKMVATNYLPEVEIGRRRRLDSGGLDHPMTPEEMEKRRRERRRTRARGEEEDEGEKLRAGQVYTFQLAFTNPLYDPIQIRLTQPHPPRNAPVPNHHLHIPTQHFTVAALKDAWAYDEEEVDDGAPLDGSEGQSEGSSRGTVGRKSLLSTEGSREKRRGEVGVEKKGNTSKVGVEVEVMPGSKGPVEFDLEVRYTYRAEDAVEGAKNGRGDEYKTFTYWIRVHVGEVE